MLAGLPAFSAAQAKEAAERLAGPVYAVKAQIHAGGRGKAGGVKIAHSADEVETVAAGMLGKCLVTKQTGPEGQTVSRLYIESGAEIARELYASVLVDSAGFLKTRTPHSLKSIRWRSWLTARSAPWTPR